MSAKGLAFITLSCLLACGGGPSAPPPAPLADGATVSPSSSLRQGQQDVSIVFARSAGGLGGASAFDLGGLVVTRQADSTDTRLVLTVSVPHGATLGPRTLTFTDARGPVSVANVVAVGAITSSPTGADTNWGTSIASFRTVKRAVEVAGAGDTIDLLDGVYDGSAGETWSYTLPAGVTIVGESMTGTTLIGPLDNGARVAGASGFRAPAGLALKTLTLRSFDTAVEASGPGALTLNDVDVRDAQTAAVRADATGITVTIKGGALGADQDAILLGDGCTSCTLDVTNTSLSGALLGGHTVEVTLKATGTQTTLRQVDMLGDLAVIGPAATLSVSGSALKETGIDARATINFGGTALDVTDSTITLAADNFGINFGGETLALSGVTIEGGHYGIYQLSGRAKLRRTKVQDYGYVGYYLAEGDLDLGTGTEAGDNAFSSGATGPAVFGIYVDGITEPVTSSNTTFNGVLPPTGTQAAGPAETIAVPGEYFINFGKTMTFWTL